MNDQTTATMMSLLPLILIFVIFYFMLIRPQKKRDKETARMGFTRTSFSTNNNITMTQNTLF